MQTPRDRMLRRAERQQARYLRRPVAKSDRSHVVLWAKEVS